jgi:hypothetical protein
MAIKVVVKIQSLIEIRGISLRELSRSEWHLAKIAVASIAIFMSLLSFGYTNHIWGLYTK